MGPMAEPRAPAPSATPDAALPDRYDPRQVEERWYRAWEERGYFRADPFAKAKPYEQNAYKIPLGKTILKRAILAAAGLPEITSLGG